MLKVLYSLLGLGVVVHSYNPSIWEAEVGRLQIQGQQRPCQKIFFGCLEFIL
jgi:hypothetical protein